MCKSEIFFRLLSLTEQETEVSRDRILGDNKDMEATDARYVLVILDRKRIVSRPDRNVSSPNSPRRPAPDATKHYLTDDRYLFVTDQEAHGKRCVEQPVAD